MLWEVLSIVKVFMDVVLFNVFYVLIGIGIKVNVVGEMVFVVGCGLILLVIFFVGLLGFVMVKLGDKVVEVCKLIG